MDKQKALELLYDASKQARLTYQDHAVCQQAYEVLKEAVKEDNEEK